MLSRQYAQKIRSSTNQFAAPLRRELSSVCILAGYPSQDYRGAQIMRDLKAKYGEDIQFFGVGGPEMQAEGNFTNIGDINKFIDKPFYPWKNAHPFHRERCYVPYMVATRYTNKQVLKEIEPNWHGTLQEQKPSLILSLGNELFSKILYESAHVYYRDNETFKPPMVHYDRFVHQAVVEHKTYLDHILYTVPKEPINWQYFKFPSTFVGSQGIFDAYRWLYSTSPKHTGLADSQGLWLNLEFNNLLMENLISEQRSAFRKANGIGETVTTMFASPGSDIGEVKKFIKTISKGASQFVNKYIQAEKMSADNFAMVVSIPQGPDAAAIRSKIEGAKWPCQLVIVDTPQGKYQAMCASDLGVAVNGETVSEAAALQLSTLILDKMDDWHTYFMLLYNNWNNDLNIANNGEIFPELTGQNFPAKVAEIWEEWYRKPKTRYEYIKRLTKLIPKMLPVSEEGTQEIIQEGLEFQRFSNPNSVVSGQLSHFIDTYEAAGESSNYSLQDHRKVVIGEMNNELDSVFV